jgi:hypothetical protein
MSGRYSESVVELPLRTREDKDDGCDIHDSCLSCPLMFCKFDVRLDWQLSRIRNANIVRLYFDHKYGLQEINDITPDVPKSTIWNAIKFERRRRENGLSTKGTHEVYRVRVKRVRRDEES